MLGGDEPAHLQQPGEGADVKGSAVGLLSQQSRQLLHRVVDQGGKFRPLGRRDFFSQHLVHLFPDNTRSVVEDVGEGLVFPVQVAHEVLGALGQPQQGGLVDDLSGSGFQRGKIPGQQPQIFKVLSDFLFRCGHGRSPFPKGTESRV